jgi:hypothetical protein
LTVACVALAMLGVLGTSSAGASPFYPALIKKDKPFGYWRLGEPPGSTVAVDASGNGLNAVYAPCVQLGAPGAIGRAADTAAVFGPVTGCSAVYQPSGVSYAGDYTAEAWVKTHTTAPLVQRVFSSRGPNSEYSFDFGLTGAVFGTLGLHADIGSGGNWLAEAFVPLTYATDTWYYVAVTVTQGAWRLYANGKEVGRGTFDPAGASTLLLDDGHPLTIGDNPRYDDEIFDGVIDEPAIYRRALTATQIRLHYVLGKAGS